MRKKKSKKLSPAGKLKGITGVIGVKHKAKVVDLTSDKGKGMFCSFVLLDFATVYWDLSKDRRRLFDLLC